MFKEKLCKLCDIVFIPDAPSRVHCISCRDIAKKQRQKKARDRFSEKNGAQVGVGSGNAQGKRQQSKFYKTGIGIYRLLMDDAGIPYICNRCNKELDKSNPHSWCTHHIDRDRHNNTLNNLERLCKRCHQLEHRCWEAIGLLIDDEDIDGLYRIDGIV